MTCEAITAEFDTPHDGLTALAQLVAVYAAAGITSVSDLARRTGYSERAIRKAKAELGCRNQSAAEPECRNPGAESGTPVPERNPGAGTRVPPLARAYKESSSKIVLSELDKNPPTPKTEPDRVRFAQGRLALCADLKTFWLTQFADDTERLDLALIEVAGRIQTAGNRPLEAQVSSQLARIVADKRDRDQRYTAVAKANGSKPANPYAPKKTDWNRVAELARSL